MPLNLKKIATPVLIAAPARGGSVEVAAYKSIASDDRIMSVAGIMPHSPTDGEQMQAISSHKATLTPQEIKSLVPVGECASCHSQLLANAELADQLEIAAHSGETFHCPMCTAAVTPNVDIERLTYALAAEYTEDDDQDVGEGDQDEDSFSDDGDDDTFDMSDTDSDDGDGDGDEFDDDSTDDGDYSDDLPEDDVNYDDDAPEDENFVPEDDDQAATAEDGELEVEDTDGDGDVDADDFAATDADGDGAVESEDIAEDNDEQVVASLRNYINKRKKATAAAEGDDIVDSDDDGIVDDNDDEPPMDDDMDEGNADTEEEIVASIRNFVHRRKVRRMAIAANVTAGRAPSRPDAERVVAAAKDRFESSGKRSIGNKKLMSRASDTDVAIVAQPNEHDDPLLDRLDDQTPGTNDEVQADALVDWETAAVDILATSGEDKWVFANGRPVGQLVKSKASTSVLAHWDTPTLLSAFKQAASRGLPPEQASEFGLVAHAYTVDGSSVVRDVIRRSKSIASTAARQAAQASTDRMNQSLKTAFLAVAKGVYPKHTNPIRDALATELSKLGVADARAIVDSAFAKNAEKFVANVTDLADDLCDKSDDARNEVATFVAQAAYQARPVDEANALSDRLVRGGHAAVAAAHVAGVAATENTSEQSVASETRSDWVRQALRSR